MRITPTNLPLAAVLAALLLTPFTYGASGYKLLRELPMPNITGWDYLSVDAEARRLYIGSNMGAVVFDIDAEKVIGNVPNPPLKGGLAWYTELLLRANSTGASSRMRFLRR